MTYTEIIALAKSYADRFDTEVADNMDGFMRIVESRINRYLKTQKMSARLAITVVTDQELYDLPADFDGLRSIEVTATSGDSVTPKFFTPEQINNRVESTNNGIAYSIIANQLQIQPAQSDATIELVYYQTLLPLTSTVATNWLGDDYPDCYVFGLLVEINSFVKDPITATAWDARFKESREEIDLNDQLSRWSGTPLQIKAEE